MIKNVESVSKGYKFVFFNWRWQLEASEIKQRKTLPSCPNLFFISWHFNLDIYLVLFIKLYACWVHRLLPLVSMEVLQKQILNIFRKDYSVRSHLRDLIF